MDAHLPQTHYFPLLVLEGAYDYWTYFHFFQGAKTQMEAGFHFLATPR